MTVEQFEKIALWMGWSKHKNLPNLPETWFDSRCVYRADVGRKTSLTDAEAVEALNKLAEKGYEPHLTYENHFDRQGWDLAVYDVQSLMCSAREFSTIHEAIEQALLNLVGEE